MEEIQALILVRQQGAKTWKDICTHKLGLYLWVMGVITEFKEAQRDDRLLDHFVTHVEDALTWRKRREI